MRPKTHSFSGFGNRPSSWVQHRPPPEEPPPPRPLVVNEISLYSRQQAERYRRRQTKPYQITHISSTIKNLNLTHRGPAKSVDAYIFTQVPSSLGSSADETEKLSAESHPPGPRDTIIEMGNGYAGYHTRKKRIVATPVSSSLSFFREILFRIVEFMCSLRGNAYY